MDRWLACMLLLAACSTEPAALSFRAAPDGTLRGNGAFVRPDGALVVHDVVVRTIDPTARVALEDGAAQVQRGGMLERFELTEEGVEQSWRFDARPEAIELRVEVSGATYLATDDAGLHFRAGDRGIRYGHATWIDADGVETPIPSRWEDGAIALRVPADVVGASRFPAVLDPIIGPEIPVDAPIVGEANGSQGGPAIAFGGGQYFAVWLDQRSDRFQNEVFGARIAPDGTVLDPLGIPLATLTSASDLAVAFDGTHFVVAYTTSEVRALRVDMDGALVDDVLVATARTPRNSSIACASDGTCLVGYAFDAFARAFDVRAQRVRAGAIVGGSIAIAASSSDERNVAVASDGAGFLVAYMNGSSGVYARRVDASGAPEAAIDLRLIPTGEVMPALAFDGVQYLAVVAGADSVVATTVPTSGDPPIMGNLLDGAVGSPRRFPSIAYDGSQYLVVWSEGVASPSIRAVRVNRTASAIGSAFEVFAPFSVTPAVASAGASFFAVASTGLELYGARVDALGSVAPRALLATGPNSEQQPAIGFDGARHLVAWRDRRNGNWDIFAARADATGAILDAPAIPIATSADDESVPSVAFDGARFVVVWERQRSPTEVDVEGRAIDPATGAVSTPATILTGARSPDIADGGVLAWIDSASSTLRVARLTAALAISGAPRSVFATIEQFDPSIARNGTSFLVAWTQVRPATSGLRDVYVAHLDAALALRDSVGLRVSNVAGTHERPDLAAVGSGWAVAWSRTLDALSYSADARVAIVGPSGGASPSDVLVSEPMAFAGEAAVGALGTGALVAFTETDGTLRGARITASGAVIDPAPGFVISAPGSNAAVSIASPTGAGAVAYVGRLQGTPRVDLRRLEPDRANGAACTVGFECASGICVDAVCCADACGGGVEDCMACSVAAGGTSDGTCTGLAAPGGRVCRAARDVCDAEETCAAGSTECPIDAFAAEGTPCPNGVACDGDETCLAGVCTIGFDLVCDDGDACTTDACVEPTGCAATPIAGCCTVDADCDDADACTDDACLLDGTCDHTPACIDAGREDDAGTRADGGRDAGISNDAGGAIERGGCGCRAARSSRAPWLFALLALLARRKRTL